MENQELIIPFKDPTPLITARSKASELAQLFNDSVVLKVGDAVERDLAYEKIATIKGKFKEFEDEIKPIRKAIQTIESWFAATKRALESSERTSKASIIAYDSELKKKAEEAARLQQEIENKAAEAKRLALEEIALEAELSGKLQESEIILKQAEEIKPAIMATVETKLDGARTDWAWELVDINKVKPEYTELVLKTSMINQLVKSSKGKCDFGAGIRIFPKPNLAVRAK